MNTEYNFENFYTEKLLPKIEALEVKRKATTSIHNFKTYKRVLLVLLVVVIVVVTLMNKGIIPEFSVFVVPLSVLFAVFYPLVVLYHKGENFLPINNDYKLTVINDLVHFVDKNLTFEIEKGLSQEEFNNANLFVPAPIYSSEDLITGEVNGILYRMSDVKAKRKIKGNKKHNTKDSTGTVFEGLYVIATCNTDFGEGIYIRIKPLGEMAINNVLGMLGVSQQTVDEFLNAELHTYETKNQAFDKMFSVKCVSLDEAIAYVSPQLIDLLISIKENLYSQKIQILSNPISIMLKRNQVHIALSELNVFDMEAFRSNTANNTTKRYYDFLQASINIVEIIKKD